MQAQRFPLVNLPVELQMEVWKHTLPGGHIHRVAAPRLDGRRVPQIKPAPLPVALQVSKCFRGAFLCRFKRFALRQPGSTTTAFDLLALYGYCRPDVDFLYFEYSAAKSEFFALSQPFRHVAVSITYGLEPTEYRLPDMTSTLTARSEPLQVCFVTPDNIRAAGHLLCHKSLLFTTPTPKALSEHDCSFYFTLMA
ncbi:hypothetical protein NM208_g6835 [Fusarium decemcellulare]|uniref:Uncharacterized protein n=1 Tax=Fusarium decemcellulare TaxID=57161 RepID=A0ACC1SBE5_9HYPO|nr:hypothetical protein NM208_g6835 [Fusarium decemcellulare]